MGMPSSAAALTFVFLLSHSRNSPGSQERLPTTPETYSVTSGEALHAAVRISNLSEIERLVEAGADVNSRDPVGSTPLLDASWIGNPQIVAFLISRGGDVNAVHGESLSTPLRFAILTGHPAVVKLLLDAGAQPDYRGRDGQTGLLLACARGNVEVAELLLAAHSDIGATDRENNTPLDQAVLHDQPVIASVLLRDGANPNRVHPQDGRGPMHEASFKGYANLIDTLAKAGADPNLPDRYGQTPLDLALAYKNPNVIRALLHLGSSLQASRLAANKAMEAAALRGQVDTIRTLIESGFDINAPTASGSTYLHDAALKGQTKAVQLLLDRGANIEAVNSSGGTPLHDAALGGSSDVMRILLDHGAAVNARDTESAATPLMLAASLARTSAISLLLARGADPSLRDRQGHSALDRAHQTDDRQSIQMLKSASAKTGRQILSARP